MEVFHTPELIILSGNPVLVGILQSSKQAFHFVNIETLDTDFNVIATDSMPATDDNSAITFNISDYLKTLQKDTFTATKLTNVGFQNSEIANHYRIRVYELWDNDGVEKNSTLLADTYTVLDGALERIYTDYYNEEINYSDFVPVLLTTRKKFLTWENSPKKISTSQPAFLYFITQSDFEIYYEIKKYFDDNTTSTHTSAPWAAIGNVPIFINTDFTTNNLAASETPTKKITKYEFWIKRSITNAVISEVKTYIIDRRHYNNQRVYIYKNSFGAYDTIRFLGVSETENQIDRENYITQGREELYFSERTNTISVNSGWFINLYSNDKQGKLYITELINSTDIYEIYNSTIIPVLPVTNKWKVGTDNNFNYSVEFEYKHKFINKNYFEQLDLVLPGVQQVFSILGYNAAKTETIDFKGLSNLELVKSNCPYFFSGITSVSAIGLDKQNYIFSTHFIRQGGNSNGFGTLFSMGGVTGVEMSYAFYLFDNGAIGYLQNNGAVFYVYYSTSFTIGQSYHLVIYKNGTDIKAYINGFLVETFTGAITATNAMNTTYPFRIGTDRPGLSRYWNGSVYKCQFAEYSSSRLAESLANNVMTGNLFYLSAGHGGGDKLYDESGNDRHFSITNAILPIYWSKNQNYFHGNLEGFELYKNDSSPFDYIRIKYRNDGTKITPTIAGYSKIGDRDGGYWHNGAETKFKQKAGVTQLYGLAFWYDITNVAIERDHAEALAETHDYLEKEVLDTYKLINLRTKIV